MTAYFLFKAQTSISQTFFLGPTTALPVEVGEAVSEKCALFGLRHLNFSCLPFFAIWRPMIEFRKAMFDAGGFLRLDKYL